MGHPKKRQNQAEHVAALEESRQMLAIERAEAVRKANAYLTSLKDISVQNKMMEREMKHLKVMVAWLSGGTFVADQKKMEELSGANVSYEEGKDEHGNLTWTVKVVSDEEMAEEQAKAKQAQALDKAAKATFAKPGEKTSPGGILLQ